MQKTRKIPSTMVTQHPDNANIPYWHDKPFIGTQDEPYECFLSFKDLDAGEYMWDWEGKLVDESVLERLLTNHYDYFKDHPIGKDKFITYRLPNPTVETEFRLGRAFMGIMGASGLAKKAGLESHPFFEVILPMTESADAMLDVQAAFREIAALKHPLLKHSNESIQHIGLIPLFEDLDTISNSPQTLAEYIEKHEQLFGFKPEYIRPFIARSDPALNAGIVPTVLSIKIALSGYRQFEERYGIPLHPILGAASLPFRGGISPATVDAFLNEYKGIQTTTIQSGFRYDYPKEEVFEALRKIDKNIYLQKATLISDTEAKEIERIMDIFASFYKPTIEQIAPLINLVAASVPKRRERVQHVGLFGYSRGMGSVKLPRAIGFTASLYSIGVPPELIGTGRGLKAIKERNMLDLLEKHYVNLRSDLLYAYNHLNKETLDTLAKTNKGFEDIREDVKEIEKYLKNEDLKPSSSHLEHQGLTNIIYRGITEKQDVSEQIENAARIRRSIG